MSLAFVIDLLVSAAMGGAALWAISRSRTKPDDDAAARLLQRLATDLGLEQDGDAWAGKLDQAIVSVAVATWTPPTVECEARVDPPLRLGLSIEERLLGTTPLTASPPLGWEFGDEFYWQAIDEEAAVEVLKGELSRLLVRSVHQGFHVSVSDAAVRLTSQAHADLNELKGLCRRAAQLAMGLAQARSKVKTAADRKFGQVRDAWLRSQGGMRDGLGASTDLPCGQLDLQLGMSNGSFGTEITLTLEPPLRSVWRAKLDATAAAEDGKVPRLELLGDRGESPPSDALWEQLVEVSLATNHLEFDAYKLTLTTRSVLTEVELNQLIPKLTAIVETLQDPHLRRGAYR